MLSLQPKVFKSTGGKILNLMAGVEVNYILNEKLLAIQTEIFFLGERKLSYKDSHMDIFIK